MEVLEKLSSATTPKDRISLLEDLFVSDFDLATRIVFHGDRKHDLRPLFKDRSFLKKFWESKLPAKYGWQIVSQTSDASCFWEEYFRQDKICDALLSVGFESNPGLMLKNLRWYGGFLHDRHWQSFHSFLTKMEDEESLAFLAGAEFFRDLQRKRAKTLKKLEFTTLTEILCSFVLISEQIYFSAQADADFIAKRPTLLSLLEVCLNEKNRGRKGDSIQWPDEKQIHSELWRQIKILQNGREPEFFSLFRELDQYAQGEYLLQMFKWHDWLVDFTHGRPSVRPRNNEWSVEWDKTEAKYRVFHDYYYGFDPKDSRTAESLSQDVPNLHSKDVVWRIYFGMRFLSDELGIEDKVIVKDTHIKLWDALVILNRFSGCYEAQYQHAMADQKRAGYDYIEAIQNVAFNFFKGPRAPLEMRNIHQIVEINKQNNVDVGIEETKGIFELGSANLGQFPVRLDGRAFLKSSSGYLLLMRYFHPDIKTTIFNAIVRQNRDGNKEYSTFQENKIAEIFKLDGWAAVSSKRLVNNLGRLSEIDVLAYKDGVLFLVEAKLTYFRTSIKEIHDHLPQLEKAGIQLERAIVAVEDNYSEVCGWLGIDVPLDSLRIVPLIVSSSFEYDHQCFNGFRKVSMFELQLLLQGTTPPLRAWLRMKEMAHEGLPTDLLDKVVSGYASDADWNKYQIAVSRVSIEDELDKIFHDGSMKYVSIGATAGDTADAIQSGEIWRHLLPQVTPRHRELVPLTIDGEVIATYAG